MPPARQYGRHAARVKRIQTLVRQALAVRWRCVVRSARRPTAIEPACSLVGRALGEGMPANSRAKPSQSMAHLSTLVNASRAVTWTTVRRTVCQPRVPRPQSTLQRFEVMADGHLIILGHAAPRFKTRVIGLWTTPPHFLTHINAVSIRCVNAKTIAPQNGKCAVTSLRTGYERVLARSTRKATNALANAPGVVQANSASNVL